MNDNISATDPDTLNQHAYAQAIGRVYCEYHQSWLRRLCRNLPVDAACDVLHDVIEDLLRQPARIGTVHNLSHYIGGALKYGAVDWIREERRRRALEARLADLGVEFEIGLVQVRVSVADFLHAFEALDRKYPDALRAMWLVRIDGLGTEAAGRRMGKSRDQIRRLLSRALWFLSSELDDPGASA